MPAFPSAQKLKSNKKHFRRTRSLELPSNYKELPSVGNSSPTKTTVPVEILKPA